MPIVVAICSAVIVQFTLKYDTVQHLITTKRTDECLKQLERVYEFHSREDTLNYYRSLEVQNEEAARKAESEPSYSEIFTEQKYKLGTEVTCLLAILFYGCGVPVITFVANNIFSKTTVNPIVGVQTLSIISLIGALIGPWMTYVATIRNIIVYGYASCALLMFIITILFGTDNDMAGFYVICVLTLIFMFTMGSYSFSYIGIVGNGNQVSIANVFSFVTMLFSQTLL